jgi:cytochrome P450
MTGPVATNSASRSDVPTFDVDLHSEEMLLDPYPTYKRFREAGGVIWLERHKMFAVPRHAELVEMLTRWKTFACGHGVGMNDFVAQVARTTLQTDPPEHDKFRKIEGKPLLPNAVKELEPELRELAKRTINELKARDRFDGVTDLAQVLPVGIVADRVGLPEEGRERMLDWAAGGFNSFGMIENERTQQGMQTMREASEYLQSVPGRLKPGGWADQLMQAEERGELDHQTCIMLIGDYVYPSLDTTIHAISAGLKLFADNPDQWDLLRENRSLLPRAVSEVVRLGTPILWFTRVVSEDYELGNAFLPAGSRVVALYGSANRDERKFPDPERFDITRTSVDQLGFGRGKHACMGMPLARLEMEVMFDEMADAVKRIEVGDGELALNNVLYGYKNLEVAFR